MALPESIKHRNIFIVEGWEEEAFFKELYNQANINNVQVINLEGRTNYSRSLSTLFKISGFSAVENLGITRDADKDATNAFESVCNILKRNELHAPTQPGKFEKNDIRIGIFILPDNNSPGMLEDLLINSVKRKQDFDCADKFKKCIEKLKNPPKNISKSLVQAYLACQREYTRHIGIAVKKKIWNVNSASIKNLVKFIKDLPKTTV